MVIVGLRGGLTSQFYDYYMAAYIADQMGEKLAIDLTNLYEVSNPFGLDVLKEVTKKKFLYSNTKKRKFRSSKKKMYKRFKVITNSAELENMLHYKGKEQLWYIELQGFDYNLFFKKYPEMTFQNCYRVGSVSLGFYSHFIHMFKERIKGKESVAIHVRRTDFLEFGWQTDKSFYTAAIQYFLEKNPQTEFYFFSDNIEAVKQDFGLCENFYYIQNIGGIHSDWEELFCISSCKYRILSTFSGYSSTANIMAGTLGFAIVEMRKRETIKNISIESYNKQVDESKQQGKNREDNILYFFEEDIINYSSKYLPKLRKEGSLVRENILKIKDLLKLKENLKAETCINQLLMDSGHLTSDDIKKLYLYKIQCKKQQNDIVILEELLNNFGKYFDFFPFKKYMFMDKNIDVTTKIHFVLVPLEYYVDRLDAGFQRIALNLARMGMKVSYIGKNIETLPKHFDKEWTRNNWEIAKSPMGGISKGYFLYPINQLLIGNLEFSEFLKQITSAEEKVIIITRASWVLNNIDKQNKIVFLDFSNKYESDYGTTRFPWNYWFYYKYNWPCLKKHINELYKKSALIVTANRRKYWELTKIQKKDVLFYSIDNISKYRFFTEKLNSEMDLMRELDKKQMKLIQKILYHFGINII